MEIRTATAADTAALLRRDAHIAAGELTAAVASGRVYVAEANGRIAGWLRYNLFWDNIPFLNMLFVGARERGRGFGSALLARWEADMKAAGFTRVLTSTRSDERAQHFYRHRGYADAGALFLPGDPAELFLTKTL